VANVMNIAMSRFSRVNYWQGQGGYGGGLWGGQAAGKSAGLAPGFGIHWQPVAKGTAMKTGPGLPATKFMTTAFEMAYADARPTFQAAIQKIAELAEHHCNNNAYATIHEAKMGEADRKGWENLGLSFSQLKSNKDYSKATILGGLTRPESTEILKSKKLGFSNSQIKAFAKMGTHQKEIFKAGGIEYLVTREDVLKTGWIDWSFKNMATGEKHYIEAAVSDFRSVQPKNVGIGSSPYKGTGGVPGLSSRLTGGGLIRFYATQSIYPGLKVTATEAHGLFYRGALIWKEAFERYVVGTFASVTAGSPKFKTGTAKSFDPRLNIDTRVNVPRQATSSEHKFYELRVWTAHPVATSWEFGLSGTRSGIVSTTVPTMTGLGEPSWRTRRFS